MNRYEIVRTHAGWHARVIASNSRTVWWTETYTRRRAAARAVMLIAGDVQVREVDER